MKLGNKIKKILSVDSESFKVKLKFSDNSTGEVDLSHIFAKPKNLAAEIIKGNLFSKCYLESGALAWPNGFELCPDALKMNVLKKVSRRQVECEVFPPDCVRLLVPWFNEGSGV